MALLDVNANVDGTIYNLGNEGADLYRTSAVAPYQDTDIIVTATDSSGRSSRDHSILYVNADYSWISPKTDWTEKDFFNIEDWHRIANNLVVIHEMAEKLFGFFDIEPFVRSKTYSSMIYASEFNAIENGLDEVNNHTYGLNIGDKKEFSANGYTIDYNELNRIESAMLQLYLTEKVHYDNLKKLAFVLGGEKYKV